MLRALVEEGISIRNLRAVFELLLEVDFVVADAAKHIIFDDRLPFPSPPSEGWRQDPANLAAFVRTGLKRQISNKFSAGNEALSVLLLEPQIEEMLANGMAADSIASPMDRDRIIKAIRAEIQSLSPGGTLPAILTTVTVRPQLRRLLADEFPALPVLAYQELSPDLRIQPLARITV
jgi:type III secretory pathway component EscV